MNYYRLSDSVLINLDSIDMIRSIVGNNIYSEYIYQVITFSGQQIDITGKQYEGLITVLRNGNHIR